MKPFSSTCVIERPISSMCPTIARDGPSAVPFTRAVEEPSASEATSANGSAARRHAAAALRSCPDGPGVVISSRRSSGSGTARSSLTPDLRKDRRAGDPPVGREQERLAQDHRQAIHDLTDSTRRRYRGADELPPREHLGLAPRAGRERALRGAHSPFRSSKTREGLFCLP